MSYGLRTIKGSIETTTQTMPGGRVCLGVVQRAKETGGVTTTTSWSNISNGNQLRVMQIGAGAHTWSVGTNGSGQATLTLISQSRAPAQAYTTLLIVFSTNTVEPDYGLALINDSGERTISTVYPTAEFLGVVDLQTTATFAGPTDGPYDLAQHFSNTISLGSGRNRIVLWSFPDQPGNDTWMNGTSFIPSGLTGNYAISANIYVPDLNTTSYYIPQALIFAVDGMVASSDQYGLRILDNSSPQKILFDSGLTHMVVKGYETSLSYASTSASSFVASSLSGNQTAIFIPDFSQETWVRRTNVIFSVGTVYEGAVRRQGTTLYSKKIVTQKFYEDAVITDNYTNGLDSGLLQVAVDAIALGGSSTFNIRAVPLDATISLTSGNSSCIYDTATGATQCSTSEVYTVTTSGGNANAKTYSWTFLNNNGTLSFSGSTTGTSVTVIKTAAQGTYEATLRCTVTQSGSNTAIVDRLVSRTHTATNSGGGGGGTY